MYSVSLLGKPKHKRAIHDLQNHSLKKVFAQRPIKNTIFTQIQQRGHKMPHSMCNLEQKRWF